MLVFARKSVVFWIFCIIHILLQGFESFVHLNHRFGFSPGLYAWHWKQLQGKSEIQSPGEGVQKHNQVFLISHRARIVLTFCESWTRNQLLPNRFCHLNIPRQLNEHHWYLKDYSPNTIPVIFFVGRATPSCQHDDTLIPPLSTQTDCSMNMIVYHHHKDGFHVFWNSWSLVDVVCITQRNWLHNQVSAKNLTALSEWVLQFVVNKLIQ